MDNIRDYFPQKECGIAEYALASVHLGLLIFTAKCDVARTQYYLGRFHRWGDFVERDIEKAEKWLLKAAEKGNYKAQHALGWLYEPIVGEKKDAKKSFYWYKKAADLGYVYSQFSTGLMYQKGIGVKQDDAQARHYLTLAANQDHQGAIHQLRDYHNIVFKKEEEEGSE